MWIRIGGPLLFTLLLLVTVGPATAEPERTEGTVSVAGAQIYYQAAGSGPPLVFLHAGLLTHRMWDEQFEAFSSTHRVIRLDLPPHGRSDAAREPLAVVDELAAFLHELGIERATLVGASLGGALAIDFALAYSERVEGLVLIGPGVDGYAWSAEANAIAEGIQKPEDLIASPYYRIARQDPDLHARLLEMARSHRRQSGAGVPPEPKGPPAAERLAEIRAPTLVIVGEEDIPDILRIAELLERSIPGAERVLIPGADHVVNMEKPEEVHRLVRAFLERAGSAGQSPSTGPR